LHAGRLLVLDRCCGVEAPPTDREPYAGAGTDARCCPSPCRVSPLLGLGVGGGIRSACLTIGQSVRARIAASRYQHPRFHAVPLHPVFYPPIGELPGMGLAAISAPESLPPARFAEEGPAIEPLFPAMPREAIPPPEPQPRSLD
jgi:hypothetical protein